MKATPPEYLYKYRPINSCTIDSLVHNEAYFALADEFNDPYDCSVVPIPVYSQADLEGFIRRHQGTQIVRDIRKNGSDKAIFGIWQSLVDWQKERTRVFCLTEQPEDFIDPIMFSHYADAHKGLCLQFKYKGNEESDFFKNLGKVYYLSPKNYPKMKFLETNYDPRTRNEELIRYYYYTKHKDWKFEKEWRIIRQEEHEGQSKKERDQVPEGILTAVIFGCKSTESDRKKIKSALATNKRQKPRLMVAVKEERSFGLRIEPLEE